MSERMTEVGLLRENLRLLRLIDRMAEQNRIQAEREVQKQVNPGDRVALCVYCGESMDIDYDHPEKAYRVLREHDGRCPDNPIVQERDRLRAAAPALPDDVRAVLQRFADGRTHWQRDRDLVRAWLAQQESDISAPVDGSG